MAEGEKGPGDGIQRTEMDGHDGRRRRREGRDGWCEDGDGQHVRGRRGTRARGGTRLQGGRCIGCERDDLDHSMRNEIMNETMSDE
jgi:hypothetical protein